MNRKSRDDIEEAILDYEIGGVEYHLEHNYYPPDYLNTLFIMAVKHDIPVLDALIAHGADPHYRNDFAMSVTLLDPLVKTDDLTEIVQKLLNFGLKFNQLSYISEENQSALAMVLPTMTEEQKSGLLYMATINKGYQLIKFLLNQGVKIYPEDIGSALSRGLNIVDLVVAHGFNINEILLNNKLTFGIIESLIEQGYTGKYTEESIHTLIMGDETQDTIADIIKRQGGYYFREEDRRKIILDNLIELAELVNNFTQEDVNLASVIGNRDMLNIMQYKGLYATIPIDPLLSSQASRESHRIESTLKLVPVLNYEELYLRAHALDLCVDPRPLRYITNIIQPNEILPYEIKNEIRCAFASILVKMDNYYILPGEVPFWDSLEKLDKSGRVNLITLGNLKMVMKMEELERFDTDRALHEVTVGYVLDSFELPFLAYVYGGFSLSTAGLPYHIHETAAASRRNYTLYEYIPGPTMGQYMTETYDRKKQWFYVIIVVVTLTYLNKECGFVHQDLHFGNILVRKGNTLITLNGVNTVVDEYPVIIDLARSQIKINNEILSPTSTSLLLPGTFYTDLAYLLHSWNVYTKDILEFGNMNQLQIIRKFTNAQLQGIYEGLTDKYMNPKYTNSED